MRKAAVKARPLLPDSGFSLLWDCETEVLDSLPPWQYRLFSHLVRLSDFRTGFGFTTYAQLVLLLTPIQPRSGPQHFVPTDRAVRDAVVGFEERRLLNRDTTASQDRRYVFFQVKNRRAEARPRRKLRPVIPTGVDKPQSQHWRGFAADGTDELRPVTPRV